MKFNVQDFKILGPKHRGQLTQMEREFKPEQPWAMGDFRQFLDGGVSGMPGGLTLRGHVLDYGYILFERLVEGGLRIHRLLVNPEFRRRSIAKQLYQLVVRQQNTSPITVWVPESYVDLQCFFRAQGLHYCHTELRDTDLFDPAPADGPVPCYLLSSHPPRPRPRGALSVKLTNRVSQHLDNL